MDGPVEMQVVHEPKTHADQDVVFIHGLRAKWQQTWCRKDFSTPWLDDLLPKELPAARILTFGYNVMNSGKLDHSELYRLRDSLLQELDNRKEQRRPLIFVAHSLGGLILKESLIEAQSRNSTFLDSTRGILFFSTPRFQNVAEWAKFERSVSKKKTGGDSPKRFAGLAKLDARFNQMLQRRTDLNRKVCCFYEALPVYRAGILVPREAAIIDGQENSGLYADHFSMTRFDTASDSDYQAVCARLRAFSGRNHQPTKMDTLIVAGFNQPTSRNVPTPDGREILLSKRGTSKGGPELMLVFYALALEDQGQYSVAENAYLEAIRKLEVSHGLIDSLTLFCRDKLSNILRFRSEYSEAEKECQSILEIRTRESPENHGAILSTTKNLALVMRYQGKYQKAYDMLVKRLEDVEDLSPTSFEHINTVGLLAKILKDLGCYEFSEYLSREIVQASISLLGIEHPYTMNRLSDLSVVLSKQGRFRYAEETSRHAHEGLEKQLGMDHPYVLRTAKRRANYMRFQGRIPEACVALESILPRQQQKLGFRHPAPLSTMCGLAATYILQGRLLEGQGLLDEAGKTQKEILGDDHPDKIWTFRALDLLRSAKNQEGNDSAVEVDPDDLPNELRDFLSRPSRPSDKSLQPSAASPSMQTSGTFCPPHPDLDASNKNSLYRLAAMEGNRSIVEAAIDKVADVNSIVNSTGGCYGTLAQAAAYSGDCELLNLLLDKGADITIESGVFHSPLKAACLRGHVDVVERLLLVEGTKEQIKGPDNDPKHSASMSPLEVAALFGHEKVARALLAAGADPNASSPLFGSVLHQAATTRHPGIVRLLLEYGADQNISTGIFGTPLKAAANAGNEAMVKILLDHEAGALSYHDSELKSSPAAGQLEVVNILLESAAKSDAANTEARLNEAMEQLTQPRTSPTNSWKLNQISERKGPRVEEHYISMPTVKPSKSNQNLFSKFRKKFVKRPLSKALN